MPMPSTMVVVSAGVVRLGEPGRLDQLHAAKVGDRALSLIATGHDWSMRLPARSCKIARMVPFTSRDSMPRASASIISSWNSSA
jgi:hypothetical protein